MCLALQDPVAWSDVANFDLSEVGTPPKHTQGGYTPPERTTECMGYTGEPPSSITALAKHCAPQGKANPHPPTNVSKSSLPSVGRRKRRERGDHSPMCDRTCPSFLDTSTNSPKNTPTKGLPFSPSQVRCTSHIPNSLNSWVRWTCF